MGGMVRNINLIWWPMIQRNKINITMLKYIEIESGKNVYRKSIRRCKELRTSWQNKTVKTTSELVRIKIYISSFNLDLRYGSLTLSLTNHEKYKYF